MHETVDGRALLHRLDEARKLLFRVEADGAGDVGGQLIGRWEVFIAQSIEASADEEPPFERLRDGVRREEEPLIVVLIAVGIGADLPADGGRGEAVFDARNARLFACDVAARGSEPAPGVLDERADDDVCPHFGGFARFDEFAVAVIDEDDALKARGTDEGAHVSDLFHREGVAELVAARTLDVDHLIRFLRKSGADGLFIDLALVGEGDGLERYLVIFERAVPLPPDDAAQGIVGRARDAEDAVRRHEQAEEGDGEGVRARKEHGRGDRALRPEGTRKDAAERVPPLVAVAVARRRGEVTKGDHLLAERIEHFALIEERRFVDQRKAGGERFLLSRDEFNCLHRANKPPVRAPQRVWARARRHCVSLNMLIAVWRNCVYFS